MLIGYQHYANKWYKIVMWEHRNYLSDNLFIGMDEFTLSPGDMDSDDMTVTQVSLYASFWDS